MKWVFDAKFTSDDGNREPISAVEGTCSGCLHFRQTPCRAILGRRSLIERQHPWRWPPSEPSEPGGRSHCGKWRRRHHRPAADPAKGFRTRAWPLLLLGGGVAIAKPETGRLVNLPLRSGNDGKVAQADPRRAERALRVSKRPDKRSAFQTEQTVEGECIRDAKEHMEQLEIDELLCCASIIYIGPRQEHGAETERNGELRHDMGTIACGDDRQYRYRRDRGTDHEACVW